MGLKTGKGSWDPRLVQPDECEGSSGGDRWACECGCLAPGAGPRPTVPGEWPSGQLASFVPTTESRCWRSRRVPWSLGQPSLGGRERAHFRPSPIAVGRRGDKAFVCWVLSVAGSDHRARSKDHLSPLGAPPGSLAPAALARATAGSAGTLGPCLPAPAGRWPERQARLAELGPRRRQASALCGGPSSSPEFSFYPVGSECY